MHSLIPCNSYLIVVTYKVKEKQSLWSSQSFWIVSISLFLSSSTWPNWLVFSCPVGVSFTYVSILIPFSVVVSYLCFMVSHNNLSSSPVIKFWFTTSIKMSFTVYSCLFFCRFFSEMLYTLLEFCSCFSLLVSMFWL